jgi:hypothetical protein
MAAYGRVLFDNYIKQDWPREVKEAGVKKMNNTAYVPVSRNVSLLREDVNAFDEAVRIWRLDRAVELMSPGYRAMSIKPASNTPGSTDWLNQGGLGRATYRQGRP